MKVTVFGAKGMVGSRVVELLSDDYDFICPIEKEVDITNETNLKTYLSKENPQVVFNFAAITDVDYCETERENKNGLVWKVNALAPKTISNLSKEMGFYFVHISTDMVFSGNAKDPGPYDEKHETSNCNDLTWYGASKAEGEKGVDTKENAVVRIIYPVRAEFPEKLDYTRKIIKLYDDNKLYPMFTDQYMNVTFIDELADGLKALAERKLPGTYHVASTGITTPYEFSTYLLEKARNEKNSVQKSSLKDFVVGKDKRRYPERGGLKSDYTQNSLGLKFSTWREIVDKLSSSL